MDSKLMAMIKNAIKSLFSVSPLEVGRVKQRHADPRNISDFSSLEEVISHSLKAPNLMRTQTKEGNPLERPKMESRPFHDEAILKKLLQHRDRIPTSTRIIRGKAETKLPS
jgi:hypothetical protein